MPSRDKRHFLTDIIESIDHIHAFAHGMTLDQYLEDRKTRSAIERELLSVSEAAIRLGANAEIICPGPDWRDIRGIGNNIRHDYDGLNDEIIWQTVKNDLSPLRIAVEKALCSSE